MAHQGAAVEQFDRWLRHEFLDLNTELEEAYFAAHREILYGPDLEVIKQAIALNGAKLVAQIVEAGTTPVDARERYQLLGAVGLYLGACRRHEVDVPEHELVESLANLLGASLGVAPRYVFAHQCLYGYRTFTALDDERVFVTHNGLGVLSYQRAAHALRRIPAMGVSSPLAAYLLEDARAALDDVLLSNRTLSETLNVDRFFLNIRPYFKPYQVGGVEFRGANAGDFAAINEIDLLLGLCAAHDPFYQRVLTEKYAYVPPEDQVLLRAAVTGVSLLELLFREAATGPVTAQLRANAERFLAVCRAHGAAYTFHHHRLVKPFLETPAKHAPEERVNDITASGPPLDVVLGGLQRLSDLRAARDRPGVVVTAQASLNKLREVINVEGR
ncbi:tryptophan 2,3-dioxygenase KynA [Asanoa ishikariensis]|uniref:Tryptophan 2,3-dioxygenase (Vermilion) n=2 Tax=Asanoa ishikariensis TaxID=137265 RepID=A0A1H3UU73_9ACTN|nr:tryptophan 2,3-dioxygenase KynA [Asanoa ishikariensis]SDZ65385.1 protein of unknown function [Asanoa ishikariensis]